MDRELVRGLDTALNEATVLGLAEEPDGTIAMTVDVLTQPEARTLVFTGAARVRVLLREDDAPVIPLDGFGAVNRHLDSLRTPGQLYGWEFFDLPRLTADWPEQVSLDRSWGRTGQHLFYWFNEPASGLVIEGTIEFDGLAIRKGDGTPIPVERFAADGVRWWKTQTVGETPGGTIIVSGRQRDYRWRRGFPWLSRRG